MQEVQVMETRKIKLGIDHLSTPTSMANLASNTGTKADGKRPRC